MSEKTHFQTRIIRELQMMQIAPEDGIFAMPKRVDNVNEWMAVILGPEQTMW